MHQGQGAGHAGHARLRRHSGGVAEAIRNGSGPAAVIMGEGDVNVMVGAAVARELYGLTCPILEVSATDYETVTAARRLRIHEGGTIVLDG